VGGIELIDEKTNQERCVPAQSRQSSFVGFH
jgi:hypothetical protein